MALSKTWRQIMGQGLLVPKLLYNLIKEVNDKVEAMDGAGEVELTQLEHKTENTLIAFNSSGVATAKKVDAANMNVFESEEQTGDGNPQNVAHGLGATPTVVFVELTSVGTDGGTVSYTKGSTNIIVTATSGAKYRVHAIK